jgi:hypothetical protein
MHNTVMIRTFLVLLTCACLAFPQSAQSIYPGQNAPSLANPEDVKSIDSIVAATYDLISGPAGKKRDWGRFRSLFYPGARLIPTGKRANETGVRARVLSPDDYVERSAPLLEKEGFFERGVANRIEHFGHIAQVFSTYESRHAADDPQPFQRGINSFQLVNDGQRWWVMTIMWEGETPDTPIPAEYLKK